MSFEHQDWKTVTLKKSDKQLSKDKNVIRTDKKFDGGKNRKTGQDVNMKKLEQDEDYRPPVMDVSIGKQIEQGRVAKKMKQIELAKACNIPVKIIQEYEKGIGIPKQAYLRSIGHQLGIKLRKSAK